MLELNPFVSVIVPTFSDWDRLKLCLDAIKAQDYPKNNNYHFLVDIIYFEIFDKMANRAVFPQCHFYQLVNFLA